MRLLFLVAVIVLAGGVDSRPLAGQENSAAPPGFTLYSLSAPGVNAPPMALRLEGGRVVAPDDSTAPLRVTESSIAGDRVSMTIETPGEIVRFHGLRAGDVLAGYALIDGERPMAVPLRFIPAGQPDTLRIDLEGLGIAPGISRVTVVPEDAKLRAGESRRFVARVFDDNGREVRSRKVRWYAVGGSITPEGEFRASEEGQGLIVAAVDGALAGTMVEVTAPRIASLHLFTAVPRRLAAGSRLRLDYDALAETHKWDLEPDLEITSSAPAVVAVQGDELIALSPGRATVTLAKDDVRQALEIEVVRGPSGAFEITGVPGGPVRTGDVVELGTDVADARPMWSVADADAEVHGAGEFVAEKPGTYTVVAVLGERLATAEIHVQPRDVAGRIHIVGHAGIPGHFTSDIWPMNGYVYLGTHQSNQIRTYDASDPANLVLTDTLAFDARVINNVKVSPDGRYLVATREGASSRRNGILLLALDDPAHPRLLSEYTETLTAGVHNVFWVDDVVYAVNDGTGDMHIIDVADPAKPHEVGRWGIPTVGRQLHDVWVQDGIAYVSYLRDGLAILDVGGAGKGGTPRKPVLVSRIFYPGGPTHNALRYGNYVFVGDEDFSLEGTVPQIPGLGADPRGAINVIDVSDLEHPKHVAVYEVPEAGAHNIWIEDGVLYAGYYQGGIRVVDVSGKLRGDLYRQGRDIAHFLPAAGPEDARLPYNTMVMGVFPMFGAGWQPQGDVFYLPDYNSGLWSFRVERGDGERAPAEPDDGQDDTSTGA